MKPFVTYTGRVVPLDRVNVDTDQIIPKQFLKRIERTGFGEYLFFDWRRDADGREKSDFILNQPDRQNATILLARKNFGCGSSREHAPWALQQYGFRAVIAPSFADIFYNNCFKNGLLPVILTEDEVSELFRRSQADAGLEVTIDLQNQVVSCAGFQARFEVDPFYRNFLIKGLDEIALSLEHADSITAFEKQNTNLRTGQPLSQIVSS
jgi:3-isopropylmalate/(R)-2-methylmalate dehydratase small subunit